MVDAVSPQYERQFGHLPRDPWRQIRKFAQEGALIKVSHGVYMFDSDAQRPNELHFFPEAVKQQILERDGYRCVVCGQGQPEGSDPNKQGRPDWASPLLAVEVQNWSNRSSRIRSASSTRAITPGETRPIRSPKRSAAMARGWSQRIRLGLPSPPSGGTTGT